MEGTATWVGALATIGLLLVTAVYAWLTHKMADASQKAAAASAQATASAERSAQAALDAARIAQSQIRVEFDGRFIGLIHGDEDLHVATIELRSAGDSIVVQRVHVRRAFREHPGGEDLAREKCMVEVDMEPTGESQLPIRLHHGERLHIAHPELNDPDQNRVERAILDVDYTFTESGGAGGTREVVVAR